VRGWVALGFDWVRVQFERAEHARFGGLNFISACRLSHRAMDDPIVYPGRPGQSHDHNPLRERCG
jgi:hypothetical protein